MSNLKSNDIAHTLYKSDICNNANANDNDNEIDVFSQHNGNNTITKVIFNPI